MWASFLALGLAGMLAATGRATVALAPPTLGRSTASTSFRLESCADNLLDYVAFHRRSRGQPGVKYVVYSCAEYPCAGLGDRLRATLVVLQVAIATQRVMLIDWTFPSPLANYLVPNLVDWRPDVPDVRGARNVLQLAWFAPHNNTTLPAWGKPGFGRAVEDQRVVRIRTNDWPWRDQMAASVGAQMGDKTSRNSALSCLFNMLYKPSLFLEAALQTELRAMFGRPQPGPYVAIHLRLGGLAGEIKEVKRHDRRDIDVLASALAYAHDLARSKGIRVSTTPIAFISDNHYLRWLIRQKYLTDVVPPTAENAAHLDQFQHKVEAGSNLTSKFLPEFVECLLLTRAACILHTKSGFSQVAVWWANHTCDMDMSVALKRTAAKVEAEKL